MSVQLREILETAKGETFYGKAYDLFRSREIELPGESNFIHRIDTHLSLLRISPDSLNKEPQQSKSKLFDNVFHKVCTDIALFPHRQRLTAWTTEAQKGKAIFVNAIMGLGKTYSIVEALGSDRGRQDNKSAIIFMPTKRLCYEMVQRLKEAYYMEHHFNDPFIDAMEEVKKKDEYADFHNADQQVSSLPMYRFKREAFSHDVYWLDGINEDECTHYQELIRRYKKHWYKRKGICNKCEKWSDCRFLKHWENAASSRIIVTTHQQYDRVYKNSETRKWKRITGQDEDWQDITTETERDYFIIDEDLVMSQCYQPISMKPDELRDFLATIIDALEKVLPENHTEIREKITVFWGRISLSNVTAVIKPMDPQFKFPDEVIEKWEEYLYHQANITPDTLEWDELIGNHILDFENAMRKGVVVQKFKRHTSDDLKEWYQIHLPNPKTYDLLDLPPHVFFDGTMLEEKFLRQKLLNVDFKEVPIDIKPLWELNIWQNFNSDLPKTKSSSPLQQQQIKNFINYIFSINTSDRKYLFITSKGLRDRFLEDYLTEIHPDKQPKIVHYGQSKGLNIAKDCDVVIMLGSYLVSDAVEIAMALDFMQDALPAQDVIKTEVNIWSWQRDTGKRVYKEEFTAVKELAEQYRFSEQRQALARARYIFHDTDFYIVSKDPVKKYDPFLQNIKEDNAVGACFPAPLPRDNKRNVVVDHIKEYLTDNKTATITGIMKKYGYARNTIRKWRDEMLDDEHLEMVSAYKFRLTTKGKYPAFAQFIDREKRCTVAPVG